MKELKGVIEINEIISELVSQFDCTCDMGLDFSYYYDSSKITWTVLITETADSSFNEFVKKEYPEITADIFLWSLLHEIGHHETCDFWSESEQLHFDKLKDELEKENTDKDYLTSCIEYYHIPDEYEATKWAANYILNNEDYLKDFWERLQEAIINFYVVNNIE